MVLLITYLNHHHSFIAFFMHECVYNQQQLFAQTAVTVGRQTDQYMRNGLGKNDCPPVHVFGQRTGNQL